MIDRWLEPDDEGDEETNNEPGDFDEPIDDYDDVVDYVERRMDRALENIERKFRQRLV